jgi:membrane protease YdiL (CAAX protease family)
MPWDFWLILLFLAVVIPWRGRVRLQRLLAKPIVSTKEKLVLYGSTIAFQWLLLALVAWRASARGLSADALGLSRALSVRMFILALAGAVLLAAFQWMNLRRVGKMAGPVPDFMRELAGRVLPSSAVEFAPYCALAVTAGVCEEFLYRGFAMAALTRMGLATWIVVIITSVLFGLAHTYQGRGGVAGTAVLGLVFGSTRALVQSLMPVVMWHAVIDLIAGIAGPKFLRTAAQEDK